jgi:uncharacterized glyoxalase superfamily protein PhnB
MSQPQVSAVPAGMHTVTPHLICAEAKSALEFYKKAFGAIEVSRLCSAEGQLIHAMFRIGDSAIMLADEMPQWGSFGPRALKGTPVVVHLYVDDADAFAQRAVAAGAKVTMPVTDMFWGDRYGQLEDPFGHRWSVATHKRDVTSEEMQAAADAMSSARSQCPADAGP